MSYPAISLSTATVGRHRCPQKRLQTARQPPVYPNSSPDHRACNSLTPFRCPHAVHSCPSVDSGLSWGSNVDYLLFYTKSDKPTFNPKILRTFDDEDARRKFPKVDENGERYNTKLTAWRQPSMGERPNLCYDFHGISPPSSSGWRLSKKRMQEEYVKGKIVVTNGKLERRSYARDYQSVTPGNLWTDKKLLLAAQSQERMGYATQKPVALMERIISASSNPGDVVLDPFCGCATTIEAAHKLDRQWIGIDIAIHAIKRVARIRLEERLGLVEGQDFTIDGILSTLEGAVDLWAKDKYHFQQWAVEQADGFVTTKRTADGGIDGRIYFAVPDSKELQGMMVEGGYVNRCVNDIRRRPSQPLPQRRFHRHIERRDRRLPSAQGPSDA